MSIENAVLEIRNKMVKMLTDKKPVTLEEIHKLASKSSSSAIKIITNQSSTEAEKTNALETLFGYARIEKEIEEFTKKFI